MRIIKYEARRLLPFLLIIMLIQLVYTLIWSSTASSYVFLSWFIQVTYGLSLIMFLLFYIIEKNKQRHNMYMVTSINPDSQFWSWFCLGILFSLCVFSCGVIMINIRAWMFSQNNTYDFLLANLNPNQYVMLDSNIIEWLKPINDVINGSIWFFFSMYMYHVVIRPFKMSSKKPMRIAIYQMIKAICLFIALRLFILLIDYAQLGPYIDLEYGASIFNDLIPFIVLPFRSLLSILLIFIYSIYIKTTLSSVLDTDKRLFRIEISPSEKPFYTRFSIKD